MARLLQITKQLNIGISTAVDFLNKKSQPIDENPNAKLSDVQEQLLIKEFSSDKSLKEQSEKLLLQRQDKEKPLVIAVKGYEEEPKPKKVEVKAAPKAEKPLETAAAPVVKEEKPIEKIEKIEKVEKTEIPQPKVEEKPAVKAEKIIIEPKIEQIDRIEKVDKIIEEFVEKIEKVKEIEKVAEKQFEKKFEKQEKPKEKEQPKFEKQHEKQHGKQPEKQIVKQEIKQEVKQEIKTEIKQEVKKEVEKIEEKKKETEIFKYGVAESRFAKKVEFKQVGKVDLDKVATEPKPMRELSRPEKKAIYKERERQKREAERKIRQNLQRENQQKERQQQQQQQSKNQHNNNNKDNKKWFEKDRKDKDVSTENQQNVVRRNEFIETKVPLLQGAKVIGKLELTDTGIAGKKKKKKNRKRIGENRVNIDNQQVERRGNNGKFEKTDKGNRNFKGVKKVISAEDVNQNIKETLARLTEGKKFKKSIEHRKDKRLQARESIEKQQDLAQEQSKILKITEFVTANELAQMMKVPVTEIIKTCMTLGIMVSINQRLDAETINIVAEEFGYQTEFVSAEASKAIQDDDIIDNEEDLLPRSPVVTVMGHVDHGKTSLLDYIRKTNVIAGEAGGITQHIGAYNVKLENGQHITFLDTPGHAAFTAMRARGAKVTDIAIIIIAADDIAPGDKLMPTTIEAINHAVLANVPIVFAINKIDKDGADPEKIKGALANMNFLVESWGGKYQSHDISAKKGIGVAELLDKVLLEAELLELKANPKRKAVGSVVEFTKDKGRGNVVTLLVENGTLKQGDIVVAGYAYGKIRAMFNERNQQIKEAKPAEPVLILGMKGELQAGDKFNVIESEQKAREIVSQRDQLKREQKLRTTHHLTLEEIGRRIALGGFQELNVIVKGDVDGSIEALSDSLIKLSTPEIQVNVIHKAVGEINESDINLAISSDAIVVGFQVRPSATARRLADTEHVDIRIYSIIYQAIEEVKSAMEGMLQPEKSEKVTATLEVRDTFHISKVGTIAGCMVRDGKIRRNSKVRLIRDGIVICTSEIESLKHEKDDVKEVNSGYECGLNIANFNDVQIGDIIEAYEEIEIRKKLE